MRVFSVLLLSVLISSQAFARVSGPTLDAFNRQINSELNGAYTYLNIAQRMGDLSLDGAAFWFMQQYYEELNHARIMMDFVQQQQGVVRLTPVEVEVDAPRLGLVEAFAMSLKLEMEQTNKIKQLFAVATKEESWESENFIRYFLTEQVEEEDMFQTYLDRLVMVANDPQGLLAIDAELGARPPAVVWMPGQPLP